mmetsp:Transcript_12573/g.37792  ORF Transcript_12573/g.37792 Transcript_12573/m.37792 type:complete len:220 (+) Transcript_12573:1434-2093(+)
MSSVMRRSASSSARVKTTAIASTVVSTSHSGAGAGAPSRSSSMSSSSPNSSAATPRLPLGDRGGEWVREPTRGAPVESVARRSCSSRRAATRSTCMRVMTDMEAKSWRACMKAAQSPTGRAPRLAARASTFCSAGTRRAMRRDRVYTRPGAGTSGRELAASSSPSTSSPPPSPPALTMRTGMSGAWLRGWRGAGRWPRATRMARRAARHRRRARISTPS